MPWHTYTTQASTATQLSVLDPQCASSTDLIKPDQLSAEELGLVHEEGASIVSSPNLTGRERGICKAILLSICTAANIGGTGTLTGTGPNLVLRGALNTLANNADTEITFGSWMPFGVATMLLCLCWAWLWLQLFFLGLDSLRCGWKSESSESEQHVNRLLRRHYEALGRLSFAEVSVLFWFVNLVLLWVFRSPSGISGWEDAFKKGYLSDAAAAMFISVILFAWPNQMPDFYCFRSDKTVPAKSRSSLMTWGAMKRRFPWSIIMLLGGGFALATAVKESGLSKLMASELGSAFAHMGPVGISIIFSAIVTFVTEVSSNTATASIFLPVLGDLAIQLCANPLQLMLPATLACSFAFMLPVSTPPNAIVYESGAVRIRDMAASGLGLNVLCILAAAATTNSVGRGLFGLESLPTWANASLCLNGTLLSQSSS